MPQPSVRDHVQRFVPELRFDRAAKGYPMSAQPFYEAIQRANSGAPFQLVENTDRNALRTGTLRTYYQVRT